MSVDALTTGSAFSFTLAHMTSALPEGWAVQGPGFIGAASGIPVPTLNGVFAYEDQVDAAAVARLLDRLAADGLPHCVQSAPGCVGELVEVCARRGMVREHDVPLMVLPSAGDLVAPRRIDLRIERLEPSHAGLHAEVAAEGFGAPSEMFRALVTPDVVALPGVEVHVGRADEEPVVTCLTIRIGEHVGIFNVATPPAHQRQGFGAAITAHAIRGAFDAGASWAWLQSSPDGYGVYQRLGFETVSSWACWVTPDGG